MKTFKTIPKDYKYLNERIPNIQKWIEELRSGRYSQITERLMSQDGYCCLGVACRTAVDLAPCFHNMEFWHAGRAYQTNPPSSWFEEEFGFRFSEGFVSFKMSTNKLSLVDLNDEYGFNFPQIAKVLELCLIEKKEVEFDSLSELISS